MRLHRAIESRAPSQGNRESCALLPCECERTPAVYKRQGREGNKIKVDAGRNERLSKYCYKAESKNKINNERIDKGRRVETKGEQVLKQGGSRRALHHTQVAYGGSEAHAHGERMHRAEGA